MFNKSKPTTSIVTEYKLIEEFNTFTYHYPIIYTVNHELMTAFPQKLQSIQGLQRQLIPQPSVQKPVYLAQNENLNAESLPFPKFETASIKIHNTSVFHNFQKHLKTLLKKVIILSKINLASLPSGMAAYRLWKFFKKQRNSSKRILSLIFGTGEQDNTTSLTKSAQQIPQIQQILDQFSISQIQAAQKLLREKVTDQILLLSKEKLKSLCKIIRFDEFYVYFIVFMDEMREGGISRRINKVRKTRFQNVFTPAAE